MGRIQFLCWNRFRRCPHSLPCRYGNLWNLYLWLTPEQLSFYIQYVHNWQIHDAVRQTETYFVDHLPTSVRMDRFLKLCDGAQGQPLSGGGCFVWCSGQWCDVRTVTGSNLNMLFWETGLSPLGSSLFKVKTALSLQRAPIPETETWRVGYPGSCFRLGARHRYLWSEIEIFSFQIF